MVISHRLKIKDLRYYMCTVHIFFGMEKLSITPTGPEQAKTSKTRSKQDL